MAIKLVDAKGAKHIKSQQELNSTFNRVTAAAEKQRSADADHALDVYNKVITDGRFVKEFATDPGGAARKLGLQLSAAQSGRIQEVIGVSRGGAVSDDVEYVAVAIIVLVVADTPDRDIVIDTAGVIKA